MVILLNHLHCFYQPESTVFTAKRKSCGQLLLSWVSNTHCWYLSAISRLFSQNVSIMSLFFGIQSLRTALADISGSVKLRHVPDFQHETQQNDWKPPNNGYFERNWFTTYTSNPIYPLKVKNLQYQFASVLNGSPNGPLHDLTSYQSINDTGTKGFVYASHGIDTPFTHLDAAYMFNGTGLLSVVNLQVAVLAWGLDENKAEYLVAYLGGTKLCFRVRSIYCLKAAPARA